METDNLDIFERIIFRIPSTGTSLTASIILGLIYSGLMYLAIKMFTSIPVHPSVIPYITLFVFVLPVIISGETLHLFLPEYPRKWGYFLGLSNQLVLFIYSLILSGANNLMHAWSILWLGLITVYFTNLIVLTITVSARHLKRISLVSIAQPLAVLAAFHFFLGQRLMIPVQLYITNLSLVGVVLISLAAAVFIVEYLIGSNVANVSASSLTAGLLKKKQEALDLGYPAEPSVQTVSIKNGSGEALLAVPWVHPGPIEGFGGGTLANDVIEHLNQDGDGFFLHVPSTHRSDPASPEDNRKIIDAIKRPETAGKASKMVKKEYSNATFYGRRFGDKKIVYIDVPDYDDFEISIFRDIIDQDDTVIVDLHQEDMHASQKEMYYRTSIAETMRENLMEFIDLLGEQELHEYRAGHHVYLDGNPLFALVEEVDGQKTLVYGVEGNGLTDNVRRTEKEFEDRFDEVVAFSTDTHASIHEMAQKELIELDEIRDTVSIAEENVSDAEAGITNVKAEKMKLLKEDYSGLIFSINIIVRLAPIILILIYLGLIIWVF